ncbi:MAG TPA: amidohydrolase family protein [Spirochaetia bacterium]|nr:amidohydrolase family protein [Spirochaetia bacterium]
MADGLSSGRRRTVPIVRGVPVFDAHCHVFNLEYLLLEITQILWDMIRGEYPLPSEQMIEDTIAVRPDFEVRSPLDAAEHFLAWILEIGFAAIGSEAAHVRELRQNASRIWNVDRIGLVPLMMDIYFLFAPSIAEPGASKPASGERRPPVRDPRRDARDLRVRALRKRMARALRKRRDSMATESDATSLATGRIEKLLAGVTERVLGSPARPAWPNTPTFRSSAGFAHQFAALSALGGRKSGVYPFFAVDARREGAVDWVITSGHVGPGGPFYGVKLYPRLGCHPLRPELDPLYSHCARNGIPITTHCSYGGFPDFLTSFAEYGDPASFRPIFERHPGIRINFAHFGDRGMDSAMSDAWGRSIAELMHDFPGAYADLSCYTHQASLERFVARFQDLPNVRERTMFGSDFNVLYFTEPGMTLERYYQRFLEQFGGERLVQMASTVPAAFLGLT